MSLNKYRVLSKIAETGKMNKAAQELVYSKPNLSRIIKTMENEYGFSLLVRTRDGVQLTENAKRLLPVVNKIIEDENELLDIVDQIQKNEDTIRNVRVGAIGSEVINLVQESVKRMEFENENITVDVRYFIDGRFFYEGLKNGDVDFCLIVEGYQGENNFEPLLKENYYAVVNKDHELADRREISYLELVGYQTVMTPDCPFFESLSKASKYKSLVVDDKFFSFPIIGQNEAVGLLAATSEDSFDAHFAAIPITEKEHITIGIASCKDRELSPAAKKFKDILLSTAEEI